MNATKNYQFVPAYYEWHFTSEDEPKKVLLNWNDPVEDLYDDFNKETGEYEDEPHLMTDFEEVFAACEQYIEDAKTCFGEGDELFEGVSREAFDQLPEDAAYIMATALYNYYIA